MIDSEPIVECEDLPEELLRHSILLFEDEDLEEGTAGSESPSAGQGLIQQAAESLGLPLLEEKPPLTYHQEVKREISRFLQQRHLVVDRVRKLAARREQARERIMPTRPVKRPDAPVLRALAWSGSVSEYQHRPENSSRCRTAPLPIGSRSSDTGKASGNAYSGLKKTGHPERDLLHAAMDLRWSGKRTRPDESTGGREKTTPERIELEGSPKKTFLSEELPSRGRNSAPASPSPRSAAPSTADLFRMRGDYPHAGRRPPSPMASQMSISFDKNLKRSANPLFSMELSNE